MIDLLYALVKVSRYFYMLLDDHKDILLVVLSLRSFDYNRYWIEDRWNGMGASMVG